MILNLSGVYRLRNTVTGEQYVGSAHVLRKRRGSHLFMLRNGWHNNKTLQASWNQHGEQSFVFEPLLVCRKEDLQFFEQRVVDTFPCVNICRKVGDCSGRVFSAESREKMRQAKLGRKYSEAHRAAISAGSKGKSRPRPTDETKAKMRASRLRFLHG